MIPENTLSWGRKKSCIRELMEYGAARKAEIGAENVYDFSIGNPSIPAPDCVNETIAELLQGDSLALHGYTTAAGILPLREKLAKTLNHRYDLKLKPDLIYVTCGAAASLTISLRAILMPGDEVIVPAPYFPEYRVFTEASGGVFVPVPPRVDMRIDVDAVADALTDRTKAVIINSPNNPSGVVFDESNLRALAQTLKWYEEKTGHPIYLITDEPYREIVYDGRTVHSAIEYYDNTIMCYSFSKSLSIPGERIGYIAVSNRMINASTVYSSILGAGRCLGYVNPPSLFQQVILRCLGQTSDVSQYQQTRDRLCSGLRELGYSYIEPQGAFYLFLKALEPDALAFSERAKQHELLLVPSDDFGCTGYVRVAYCVSEDMVKRSMPAFKALMEDYT